MKRNWITSTLAFLLVITTLVGCSPKLSETPFYMEEPQLQNSESPELYFVAYLEKGLYDLTYGENANFGILTARKDELPEDAEITMENATAYPASSLLEETKSYCRFSASIKDLSADLYEVEFVARAYVTVGDTVHYSEQITTSFVQVAEKILEQNENADDAAVARSVLARYRAVNANNQLIAYPEYPEQIERDYEYSVTVEQGTKSENLVVYNQTEAFFYQDRFDGGDVNRRFCEFAFSGVSVTVHVKVNRDFDTYAVVPTSKGFASTYADGVISVTLKKPEQFLIILDDDVNTALAVFADARETDVPNKSAPNTIYVEGWNQITFNETGAKLENGILAISKENIQLYIAPGAVLTARVQTKDNANGVKIFGRGAILDPSSLIYQESEHGFDNATNDPSLCDHLVRVRGYNSVIKDIKLLDARCYNLNVERGNGTVQNVKILSSMMTSDGITTTAENGTVKDCFVYCGDNAIVPQVNVSAGYTGYSFDNITVGTSCSAIYPQHGVKSTLSNIYVFRADEGLISMKEEDNNKKYLTVKNLDALDCVTTPRLFYATKQGSAEKVLTLSKVLMRYTTGSPGVGNTPGTSTNAKTLIAFAGDAGSNFTIKASDLYVGGTLITNRNQILVSGSSSLKQISFTSTAVVPQILSGSRFVANYDYASKVMLGSCQLFFAVEPVQDGDTWYLPYEEVASYLAVAPQNPATTQINGVEMISLSNLLASGAVTAADYKNGAIRLTPAVNSSVNLLKEDYGLSSNYNLLDYSKRTKYVAADYKDGEWIYTTEAESDNGGIFRMILDVYKTYGKGNYTLKFDYKASAPIYVGVGVDHNETKYIRSASGASSTEWKTETIKFNFTDSPASVKQMALWFWTSGGNTISLKNISLTKTS